MSVLEELILKYPTKKWDWDAICANPCISTKFMINLKKHNICHPFKINWKKLSKNPNIALDLITKYIDKKWDWRELSNKPCVTTDFIDAHLDKPWDWKEISNNPNLTMKFINSHPKKPFDWDCFAICSISGPPG